MTRTGRAILLIACLGAARPAAAQEAALAPAPEPERVSASVPLASPPGPATVMAGEDRWSTYAKAAFRSPAPIFATVMPALAQQQQNAPSEYGRSWPGFGDRVWRRGAQYQLQTALYHASAAALGTEARYRPCACTGGGKRLGYALSRSFVTRTASGRTVPNVAYAGGLLGGAAIAAEAWYPGRYSAWREGLAVGGLQFTGGTLANVLLEFAPELKRVFRRR